VADLSSGDRFTSGAIEGQQESAAAASRVLGDDQTLVDRGPALANARRCESDQILADRDQTLSDGDQTAGDRGEAAADSDRASAASDLVQGGDHQAAVLGDRELAPRALEPVRITRFGGLGGAGS
jgi:hypothetical protein